MAREFDLGDLLERFGGGAEAALARAISVIEDERPGYEELLHRIYPKTRQLPRLGITGPPGAGKSTLVGKLAGAYSEAKQSVGIVAVDPTSPFTGGALLGDRIRMDDVGMLPGVFIRSMGTRGSLGGLARSTREVAMAMDAFGKDRVIIETVGVGQSELDIAGAADTTVVVLVPESGDGVQAMKAGLMEIADIIVLNKADREGADKISREIQAILGLKPTDEGDWAVPVIPTIARDNIGVDEVIKVVDEHKAFIESTGVGRVRHRDRVRSELTELLQRDILDIVMNTNGIDKSVGDAIERILDRDSTPYNECEKIINKLDISEPGRR